MKNKIFLLVIGLLFTACHNNRKDSEVGFEKNGYFVISKYQDYENKKFKEDSIQNRLQNKDFRRAGEKHEGLYGKYNFVVYNDSVIYFYQDNVRLIPGTNKEATRIYYKDGSFVFIRDSTQYPRLFLSPKRLEQVKINDLSEFLHKKFTEKDFNYLFKEQGHKTDVSVSSLVDTIKNKGFRIIYDSIKNKGEIRIRYCTVEEQLVADAKFHKRNYNPSLYNWDSILSLKTIRKLQYSKRH